MTRAVHPCRSLVVQVVGQGGVLWRHRTAPTFAMYFTYRVCCWEVSYSV